jgi:hypothetical protein
VHGFALVVGWFLIPIVLLWLGSGLRHRTVREKRAFWGGVIGHTVGMLATLWAAMLPPVLWTDALRTGVVHWGMVVGAIAGAAAAWLSAAADEPSTARTTTAATDG